MLACVDVDAWQACGAPERCGILRETVCTICFIFSSSAKSSKDDRGEHKKLIVANGNLSSNKRKCCS